MMERRRHIAFQRLQVSCTHLLPHDAMLLSCVCPSICLSVAVTSRCSTETAKHGITQTTSHDSSVNELEGYFVV